MGKRDCPEGHEEGNVEHRCMNGERWNIGSKGYSVGDIRDIREMVERAQGRSIRNHV